MDPRLQSALHILGQPEGDGINEYAIKGEPGTGFEKRGNKGPFECGNCEYFDDDAGACHQEDMMRKSKQPRLADGRVQIAADDCCEYIERVGRYGVKKD